MVMYTFEQNVKGMKLKMKLVSWNVNGLRAAINKGFNDFFNEVDADIFCIQETKMQEDQIDDNMREIFKEYNLYWNSAEKKGYSGTAIFTKQKPINAFKKCFIKIVVRFLNNNHSLNKKVNKQKH